MSRYFFFVFAVLLWGNSALAEALSLEKYLAQVKEANPTIKAASLRALAQENRVSPSRTWDDPFFAVGLDKVPTEGEDMTSMTQYQLSQTIPFPGKLSAKGKIEETRAEALKSDVELTTRQITILARQLYYRKFYNKKSVTLNERMKKYLETLGSSARAAYKTGGASHHDWLLARAEASILQVERLKLNREDKVIQALMNQLRDSPPENTIDVSDVDFKLNDPEDEKTPEVSQSPELRSLSFAVESAEAESRLAKLSYFPDIVVQGMYEKPRAMGMTDPSTWGVMVGVSIPLFFFSKQSDLVSAAESEKAAAIQEAKSLENQLRTEVLDAKEQLRTAKDTVALFKNDIIPVTELAVKNAQTGYSARRMGFSQLVESLRSQRQQELEYLASQIDVELSRLRMKEILSSPLILKLGPSRPSLFGGTGMSMPVMSDTTSMGRGMSGPTRSPTKRKAPSSKSSMEGM